MIFALKLASIIVLLATALAPLDLHAQATTSANIVSEKPRAGAAQLTGKERLGEKWKDEQRVDNCKVPIDRRGTTPRPVNCGPLPSR